MLLPSLDDHSKVGFTCSWDDLGFTTLYYPRSGSFLVSASSDIRTLTVEQYLALSGGNQAPSVVKPEIEGNMNFEIKIQFMRELREDTFSKNKNKDAYDHIDQVLGIVGYEICKGPHINKDCPLNEEVKQVEEVNFGDYGRLPHFNNGAKFRVGRYSQWQSSFLRYIDTKPNGYALRKCILEGPYVFTNVTVFATPATNDSPGVAEHSVPKTLTNMFTENKAHYQSKKEAIFLLLTSIGDEIYSTFNVCKTAHDLKQKQAKDYNYHKEKMLCKQAEKGVPLQAEQAESLKDTNEKLMNKSWKHIMELWQRFRKFYL
nr:hypothetical protein [Tanacetum cinerariifolium]